MWTNIYERSLAHKPLIKKNNKKKEFLTNKFPRRKITTGNRRETIQKKKEISSLVFLFLESERTIKTALWHLEHKEKKFFSFLWQFSHFPSAFTLPSLHIYLSFTFYLYLFSFFSLRILIKSILFVGVNWFRLVWACDCYGGTSSPPTSQSASPTAISAAAAATSHQCKRRGKR